jgi:hypothetical protein
VKNSLKVSLVLLFATVSFLEEKGTAQSYLATGRLVGHVYCSDTNGRPARLAKVWLRPAPDKTAKPFGELYSESSVLHDTVTTDMNGTFIVPTLNPGSYYVFVDYPGYQNPALQFTNDDLESPTSKLIEDMDLKIPRVTINTGLTANIVIQLQRGAAVNGSLRYDDGSPAISATVQVLQRQQDGSWRTSFGDTVRATTDDLGKYRISGMGPGKYVIKYTMRFVIHEEQYAFPEGQTPAPIFIGAERTFDIYSGGAFRQKDAEIIELKSGAVNNADTVIPLAKLHPLTGRVTALSDGHLLNGGSAELLYADDGTKVGDAPVLRDGIFRFALVPEGQYILRVQGSDALYDGGGSHTIQEYEASTQSVSLSKDTDDVDVQLRAKNGQ